MPRVAHGSSATPEQLRQAHEALADRAAEVDLGPTVPAPAISTDFAQFVDHDITFETSSSPPPSCSPLAWRPCPEAQHP
jgi:hypothetical protein